MIRPQDWQPADALQLETSAMAAATEQTRSLALTAGPGAGKTEMLAQRADFLLRTGSCHYPRRILAISFKVDSSRNLKERVRHRCGLTLASRFDSHTFHAFAKRIIDRFRVVLIGANAIDAGYTVGTQRMGRQQIAYDDLVPFAIQILLTCAPAKRAVQMTYGHVFLDEFQDCTGQQYELIREAFHGSGALLTAVGDTKQRIMGWAGALEGVFGIFATDFQARPLNLYQNFRSLPRLRRIQNEMVRVMDPPAVVPAAQLVGVGGECNVLSFQDSAQEAAALAALINQWVTIERLQPSDIVILVRYKPPLFTAHIVALLQSLGVPVRDETAANDLESEPAARFVVDLLAVTTCERQPDAYEWIMNTATAWCTDDEDAATVRQRWQRSIADARATFASAYPGTLTADQLWPFVKPFVQLLGIDALRSMSPDYATDPPLKAVIKRVIDRFRDLLVLDPSIAVAIERFAERGAVRIMTIHKSKGLEFDSVIVVAVETECYFGSTNEARAEFFVAISRAKRRLVLTTAARRPRPLGAPGNWREARTPFAEFLTYANTP
jgi:superfamily I DNA/RNA helicase